MVKQTTYDQVEQDLLRKAIRVNFALTQEDLTWGSSDRPEAEQDLLKFLSDSFDTRITIYDLQGTILSTSAEQEVLPGSKVDAKLIKILTSRETDVTRVVNKETGQISFVAAIPMINAENTKDTVEKGILLETQPTKIDLAINSMQLSLFIGGTIILIIIIVISVYMAMSISRPITRLTTSVTEISRENFVLNDVDQSMDEINDLAGQINKLAVRLEKKQTESGMLEGERTRLFADISHELRTPLTAVRGFTEAIRDGMVEDETIKTKYLDMIYTQTLHIIRLVDDILALSRLESGNVTVEKLPLDLGALAQGVVMTMESLAKSKNNYIVFEKKTEKAIVVGDVDRMEQILKNLMKNAIRATENGTIKVGIESHQGDVILTIEDNGIGISPDDLPHIWDRFYRVINQRNNNIEEKGNGLGLVIVNKLVQLQGGKIEAESQPGEGTIFRISFQLFTPS
ncbi:MAG: sensor histidine kinase [Mobilitalea sp.]